MKEGVEKEVIIKHERSIVIPFLIGGVVGAIIGLLMAPKAGKEMREDIKDFALQTKDTLSTSFDKSKTLYEDSKEAVIGAIEAGKEAFQKERDKHRHAA
jgi:gas vesicle protein